MSRRWDKIWVGILVGVLIPFLVMMIYYLSTYAAYTVPDFLRKMIFAQIFFPLLSLCAIINLASFFLFYQTQNDKAARGVIFATMIFAFAYLIYKASTGLL